ncbi:MAG: DUF4416 family protein [Spirochaetia bacterium]|nr:DUF4416 family protein [Spirochaetia bacterium]
MKNNLLQADKSRFFALVFFENEEDLIYALEIIEKTIAKYDYISSYIKCPGTTHIPVSAYNEAKARIISFPKIQKIEQFSDFARKIFKKQNRLIKQKGVTVKILPGYINSEQAVAAYEEFNSYRITLSENIFIQIELIMKNSKLDFIQTASREFRIKNVISFLSDVRRLFLSSVEK